MKQERLNRIYEEMKVQKIDRLLISDPTAIFYLTGKKIYPGERMLILSIDSNGTAKIFVNAILAFEEDVGAEVILYNDTQDPVALLAGHIKSGETLGIDKNWPAHFLLKLQARHAGCHFVNGSIVVDRVRMVKDADEIALMQEASRVNDLAMERLIKLLPNQWSEEKMGKMLAAIYEELGAKQFSFEPIVCYGAHTADPHHVNGDRRLAAGDAVMFDIGCIKDSYCSDMTRTFFYKQASKDMENIYHIVLEANQKAIEKVKPGVSCREIDLAARELISAAGYGEYFIHRTGHFIGLEDHEYGDISSENSDLLKPGMIFSVEPGIYLPGRFGVRIEDLVVVTTDGCKVLNTYSKDLQVII